MSTVIRQSLSFLFLLALCKVAIHSSYAQSVSGLGTVIENGWPSNKWLLHNPGDNRQTLFLAPMYNGSWDFSQQTQFRPGGDVTFSGKVAIGTTENVSASARLEVRGDLRTTTGKYSSLYSENAFNTTIPNVINQLGASQLSIGANWANGLGDLSLINSNIAHSVAGAGFGFYQMTSATDKRALAYIRGDGKMGIGTMTPVSQLHVAGGGLTVGSNSATAYQDGYISLGDVSQNSTPINTNWASSTTLLLNALDYSTIGFHDSGNRADFIRGGGGTIQIGYDGGFGMAHVGLPNGVWKNNGNVGIGTTDPGSYKLAVEGKIGAREVEVKSGSWPDYVFKPTFALRPLSEVKQYIAQHGHLPDIPSEAEVQADGIRLGEMNARLLQKIEELTLYLLRQQEEIDALKKQLSSPVRN